MTQGPLEASDRHHAHELRMAVVACRNPAQDQTSFHSSMEVGGAHGSPPRADDVSRKEVDHRVPVCSTAPVSVWGAQVRLGGLLKTAKGWEGVRRRGWT